jgi:hypothetical protein
VHHGAGDETKRSGGHSEWTVIMSKLMLLAAGILSALALMAPPSAPSAGTGTNNCRTPPCTFTVPAAATPVIEGPALRCKADPCVYRVQGDGLEMLLKTDRFECKAVVGHGQYMTAWESRLDLKFRGCIEEIEGIDVACSTAHPRQLIEPRPILLHNGLLPTEPGGVEDEPGMFGNLYITFTCGGLLRFLVEGIVNATVGRAVCGLGARQYELQVAIYAHGGYDRARQSAERLYDLSFNDNADRVIGPKTRVGIWQMAFAHDAALTC